MNSSKNHQKSITLYSSILASAFLILGNISSYHQTYLQAPSEPPPEIVTTPQENPLLANEAILGDPNAPVTIIEFSDYKCPFCLRFHTDTLPQIKTTYIDTGKVKYAFRNYPLAMHNPEANLAAMAAECARDRAGDSSYFTYHDLIFEAVAAGKTLDQELLYDLGEELDINRDEFTICLDGGEMADEVSRDIEDAKNQGIRGTPSFLINDQLVSGAQPFSNFETIIEEILNN